MNAIIKILAVGIALFGSVITASAEIRLGILATSGEVQSQKRWAPLAAYLSEAMGEQVTLLPMAVTQGNAEFALGNIDIMLGNPGQAVKAKNESGAEMLASLVKKHGSGFAGVIVTNPTTGIKTATDLRGKKVMSIAMGGAGGYMFQAGHLLDFGVVSPDDFATHAIGKNQEDIVKLVINGVFDAGFVRSGIIERMIAKGSIQQDQIVVVDERTTPGFPLRHTTRLFPEWFAYKAKDFDATKAARFRAALIEIQADHPALKIANVVGFEPARDLSDMEALLRQLGKLGGS